MHVGTAAMFIDRRALPSSIMRASSMDIAIETLELAHQGWKEV